jgi:hypothetical protein
MTGAPAMGTAPVAVVGVALVDHWRLRGTRCGTSQDVYLSAGDESGRPAQLDSDYLRLREVLVVERTSLKAGPAKSHMAAQRHTPRGCCLRDHREEVVACTGYVEAGERGAGISRSSPLDGS